MNNKRNRIPTITEDRIDLTLPLVERPITAEDIRINNLLKGKESTQVLTTRIPKNLYKIFREIAFKKNIKMNKIVVGLIEEYINNTE